MGAGGHIGLEDIFKTRHNNLTPGQLLAVIYTNPKARFQLSYHVCRVIGVGQKFLIPDIGIRALQGHSRDAVGPEVLTAAQAELYHTSRLPEYCVHGTSTKAWENSSQGRDA